jgi:hypothetical protein
MSKEILDMFKKVFDEHFCREFAISLGYSKACQDGFLTENEAKEMADFMANHSHAKFSLKVFKERGGESEVLANQIEKAMKELKEKEP